MFDSLPAGPGYRNYFIKIMFRLTRSRGSVSAGLAPVALLLALLALSGCDYWKTSGPKSAARQYVQALIEQTGEARPDEAELAQPPGLRDRNVIAYARALYRQGVVLGYRAEASGTAGKDLIRIMVEIVPKFEQLGEAPPLWMMVELKEEAMKDNKRHWRVVRIDSTTGPE